ncbi:thymidine phosphorylase [Candidatus Riflebacteria bacterium]
MRFYDIIYKKRNGGKLNSDEIKYWIDHHTRGELPDEQVTALLMAIYFKGMDAEETLALTRAMIASGETVAMDSFDGYTIDKHSTGGVGDKTSLVLGPLMASLGLIVGKMSGRGLGHTGGTLDKLESFKGFKISIPAKKFKQQVNDIGLAIIGQTKSLAPADKKLYALRDVTATVDSIPLIAGSIMSKKLAIGNKGLILDVKSGSGAFMKSFKDSKALAKIMVEIGKLDGRDTMAIISNMDQPLGIAVGNSLEVIEAIETLEGKGPEDFTLLVKEITINALKLSGLETNRIKALKKIDKAISEGAALKKFEQMVEKQGGDAKAVKDPSRLQLSRKRSFLTSPENGYLESIHTENVGIAAMLLGAGRERKEDDIDLSVGFKFLKKIGDSIKKGEKIIEIFHNNRGLTAAQKLLKSSISFCGKKVKKPDVILGRVK